MNTGVKRGLWVAALLVCLAVVAWSVRGLFAFGEVPISQAPSTAPSPVVSASPSGPASPSGSSSPTGSASPSGSDASTSSVDEASAASDAEASDGAAASSQEATTAPEATASAAPTPAPTPTPTPIPTAPPAAPMDDITAAPVHVDVYRGEEQVIGAEIVPEQQDEDGELNPEPQHVGWYAPPQWNTVPGELSSYPGVLTGHVIHSGLKDVFYRLEETKAGDRVVITYKDGTRATFTLDTDPVRMDKQDLVHSEEFAWAWRLSEPGRKVTLITCELVPGSGMTGHSVDNWVVQATRVE